MCAVWIRGRHEDAADAVARRRAVLRASIMAATLMSAAKPPATTWDQEKAPARVDVRVTP